MYPIKANSLLENTSTATLCYAELLRVYFSCSRKHKIVRSHSFPTRSYAAHHTVTCRSLHFTFVFICELFSAHFEYYVIASGCLPLTILHSRLRGVAVIFWVIVFFFLFCCFQYSSQLSVVPQRMRVCITLATNLLLAAFLFVFTIASWAFWCICHLLCLSFNVAHIHTNIHVYLFHVFLSSGGVWRILTLLSVVVAAALHLRRFTIALGVFNWSVKELWKQFFPPHAGVQVGLHGATAVSSGLHTCLNKKHSEVFVRKGRVHISALKL